MKKHFSTIRYMAYSISHGMIYCDIGDDMHVGWVVFEIFPETKLTRGFIIETGEIFACYLSVDEMENITRSKQLKAS